MFRVFILLTAVFFPIFSFAGTIEPENETADQKEAGLPAVFTMDELTPGQRKDFEENYVTDGAFKVDLSSKGAEIKKQPLSAEELTEEAGKLFKHGRTQEAIAKAQEAIDQDKEYLPAYRIMADILQESGSVNQSILLYNMILQKDPNDAEIYMNRGYAYGRLNQLKPAIDDYNKAIELDPKAAHAISARAAAYAKMGEMELAKRDYENLMNFNEEQACFGLGNIAAYYHRWEEALGYYDRTSAVSPNFAPAYLMKGQILLQIGKKQEAIDAIKKAKSLGMGIPPDLEEVIR